MARKYVYEVMRGEWCLGLVSSYAKALNILRQYPKKLHDHIKIYKREVK